MINEQRGRNINMQVSGSSTLQRGCAATPPVHEKSLLQNNSPELFWTSICRHSDDLCRETNKDIGFQFAPLWPSVLGSHASPARWWVWISSRPVRVLRDLRSLKATTGTMSSSLVSTSCDVFDPTGSLTASSMVPLCTGCVFSFGLASFGKAFTGSDLCQKKRRSNLFSQGQAVWIQGQRRLLVGGLWTCVTRARRRCHF